MSKIAFLCLFGLLLVAGSIVPVAASQYCEDCAWNDTCLPVAPGWGHESCEVKYIVIEHSVPIPFVLQFCILGSPCDFDY